MRHSSKQSFFRLFPPVILNGGHKMDLENRRRWRRTLIIMLCLYRCAIANLLHQNDLGKSLIRWRRRRGGELRVQERAPPEAAAGGRGHLPGVSAFGLPHEDDLEGDGPAGGELCRRQGDAGMTAVGFADGTRFFGIGRRRLRDAGGLLFLLGENSSVEMVVMFDYHRGSAVMPPGLCCVCSCSCPINNSGFLPPVLSPTRAFFFSSLFWHRARLIV